MKTLASIPNPALVQAIKKGGATLSGRTMRVASSVQFLLWPLLAGFSLGQTTTEAPLLTEQA